MITISADALASIHEQKSSLYIDIPHTVRGCCFDVTECPTIRFGEPKARSAYTRREIQECTVYVPNNFPESGDYVIRTKSFLGFKRLVLSGWRLI